MRLHSLILKNFRNYNSKNQIEFNDLTAIIGKNDVGKSSILEALDIFFENRKIEQNDACVRQTGDQKIVVIGVVFSEIPETIILDATNSTTLENEFLLREDGLLEIQMHFNCALKTPSMSVFANAFHPSVAEISNLLELKQADLRSKARDMSISLENKRSNASIRSQIRDRFDDKKLEATLVPLNKEEGKKTWEAIKKHLPIFALFQSDRKSEDSESEVQDPMKIAIKEALEDVKEEILAIEKKVKEKVILVAQNTLKKLNEMDSSLAQDLKPYFNVSRKWDTLFKLSIEDDEGIPINKRGSGVRRLVLLNFFRAEAERKKIEKSVNDVIYAFEEPENSQHPNNQKLLIEAFKELAFEERCQVLLTTHNPALAEIIEVEDLRLIQFKNQEIIVSNEGDLSTEIRKEIAETLGIFPDANVRDVKVLICTEGKNDILFLKNISKIINKANPLLPDLEFEEANRTIAFLPLGGSQLKHWVENNYLKSLGVKEFHLYDGDKEEYQVSVDMVNARNDGSFATRTKKRELENYLHSDAIKQLDQIEVVVEDMVDLPLMVAKCVHEKSESLCSWADVLSNESKLKSKVSGAKARLNTLVASNMTLEQINERDPQGEIESWLLKIKSYLDTSSLD